MVGSERRYDAAIVRQDPSRHQSPVRSQVWSEAKPTPDERPGPLLFLKGVWVAIKATVQSYPSELRQDDPRLAPVAGLSLPAYAVAAAAIGWATDDAALVARVTRALGLTPEAWQAAIEGWTARIEDDVVIATMYGQLFAQVGELPLQGSPPERPGH